MAAQDGKPGVRFSSVDERIEPDRTLDQEETPTNNGNMKREDLSPEALQELKDLHITMNTSNLHTKRMGDYTFEPVSLPASRAPSPSSGSRTPSLRHQVSESPRGSPLHTPNVHSPPLTPSATVTREGKPRPGSSSLKEAIDPAMMTPEVSPPHEPPPTSMDGTASQQISQATSGPNSRLPSPRPGSRPGSRRGRDEDVVSVVGTHPKHVPSFSVAPAGDSFPPSRDPSPGRSLPTTPNEHSENNTPIFSRPYIPPADKDNPYSRSRRAPQVRGDNLDPRFKFAKEHAKKDSRTSASVNTAQAARASALEGQKPHEKRSSGLFKSHHDQAKEKKDKDSAVAKEHGHGSMSELKRFFKFGVSKNKEKKSSSKPSSRAQSPSRGAKSSGTRTPPVQSSPSASSQQVSVPFADDHGLQNKYGKFGKVLGSGAGGSVRLMKRSSDGVTFAVKQFRAKHSYESERDYTKKVTGEFCIGSTLHHGNIIETMDLVNEKGNWYVVMEYAPYDLFATVMTGKMTREEVTCSTLQILSGVTYLHSMGLAHRDLKLDNVVVNEHGIMKIIDFGSAAVFRYPFENDVVLASGIVGSDPYLAPEVYDKSKYDPQPTDIWSLAIIFCCMSLKRFPWKQPRVSDNSYKLFVAPPEGDPRMTLESSSDKRASGAQSEPASREASEGHRHHHHHHHKESSTSAPTTREGGNNGDQAATNPATDGNPQGQQQPQQQPTIKGPWRLLRLLPRESRYIIGRMLEIDPQKRATLEEVLADKWVASSPVCRQEEGGRLVRAGGHEHTLQPGDGDAPTKKS